MNAHSTGAPRIVSPWPLMWNSAAVISSWMVLTSLAVLESYTVIVCLYIMFWAKT